MNENRHICRAKRDPDGRWFEDLLWEQAFKDVFKNPEHYFEGDSE